MIIIGGGEFTDKIIQRNKFISFFKISGNKRKASAYAGKNLINIENIEIPKNTKNCIINWSYTYIENHKSLILSIEGTKRIAKFILKNPNLNYIYISSTSADPEYNYKSLYGISKFLSENILGSIKKLDPRINLNIIRLGMLYGLRNCPIKKFKKYRRIGIKLMPGEPDAKFAVSSSDEIINYLIDPNSEFWVSKNKLIYSVEKTKISINDIHNKRNDRKDIRNEKIKINIKNKSLIHQLINIFGKKIDLTLSEQNRYPNLLDEINLPLGDVNKYINKI